MARVAVNWESDQNEVLVSAESDGGGISASLQVCSSLVQRARICVASSRILEDIFFAAKLAS